MADIQNWWRGVPIITKTLFATSIGVTLASNFGLLSPYHLVFDSYMIFHKAQIWRLFTCLFIWKLGFGFLVEMYMLVRHSQILESQDFLGRTADYLWMFLLSLPFLWLGAHFFSLPVLGAPLVMVILYVWARKYPTQPMTFMFGIRFQSAYLPWVLLLFHLLMGGSPVADLMGILIGHLYWFASDVLPRTHRINLVKTPSFLSRLIPNVGVAGIRYVGGGFDARPLQARPPEQIHDLRPRHNWGDGHQLGQ